MKDRIIKGYRLDYQEAVLLSKTSSTDELLLLANDLRLHFRGNKLDTCMIFNAKSGKCSEDCKWCSQSQYHSSEVPVYDLVEYATIKGDAQVASDRRIDMFSLVTSGRKLSPKNIQGATTIIKQIKADYPNLGCCASMGLLNRGELQQLYDAGVRRYHCNIETAPSRFGQLCTTHTLEEKIKTIKNAQAVGLIVCSGGIIGMGETEEHRIEMAILLQELGIRSIPINLLNPIKGTPLENAQPLSDDEVLRSFALFRILNPEADIRLAGGRLRLHTIQDQVFKAGISASIVGNYLTTLGVDLDTDLKNFRAKGYTL